MVKTIKLVVDDVDHKLIVTTKGNKTYRDWLVGLCEDIKSSEQEI